LASKCLFSLNGKTYEFSIVRRKPQLVVAVDGKEYTVNELLSPKGISTLLINNKPYEFRKATDGDKIYLAHNGIQYVVDYEDPLAPSKNEIAGENTLVATMPGVVVEVRTASGSTVTTGETLMIVESMKIQTNIVAPRDGEIDEIHIGNNEAFDKGAALLSLRTIAS
jgi:biotin carboxyl carrier protein